MNLPGFTSLRLNLLPRFYRCEPGWQWSPPPFRDYDLWCVREGYGQLRLEGVAYGLEPGICFLLPPGRVVRATQEAQRRLMVFAVHFDFCDATGKVVRVEGETPLGKSVVGDGLFFTLAEEAVKAQLQGGEWGLRCAETLVAAMVLRLWGKEGQGTGQAVDVLLQGVIAAIETEPGRVWEVGVQAAEVGLSVSQYTRRFLRQTGMAPAAFVIACRLERAQYLLRETTMSLTQIASVLGYRDLYYFSRQFKAKLGITPSGFREGKKVSVNLSGRGGIFAQDAEPILVTNVR